MAAILCRALVTPFIYCGKGLNACCQQLGKCCGECCDACGECTKVINQIFDKPLSCCTLFTVLMNLVPFIAAIILLAQHWTTQCDKPLHIWLLITIILMFINCSMAFYLIRKIALENMSDLKGNTTFQKLSNFLLYDIIVCFFIIISLFGIAWGFVGASWLSSERDAIPSCRDTESGLYKMCQAGVIILEVFYFAGTMLVLISLLCTCSCFEDCFGIKVQQRQAPRREQYSQQQQQQQQQQYQQQSQQQQQLYHAAPVVVHHQPAYHQPAYQPQHEYNAYDQPPQYEPSAPAVQQQQQQPNIYVGAPVPIQQPSLAGQLTEAGKNIAKTGMSVLKQLADKAKNNK